MKAIAVTKDVLKGLQKLLPEPEEVESRRLQLRDLARIRLEGTARQLEKEVRPAVFRFQGGLPAG